MLKGSKIFANTRADEDFMRARPALEAIVPFVSALGADGDALQDDCANEMAVDQAAGLAENYIGIRILLVDGIELSDPGFILDERPQGFAAAGQRDENDIRVPLVKKLRHDLGGTGQDAVCVIETDEGHVPVRIIRNFKIDVCHIESFSAKVVGPSAEIWQMSQKKKSPTPDSHRKPSGARE